MSTCRATVPVPVTDAAPADGLGAMEPFAPARPDRAALLGGAPLSADDFWTLGPWTTVSII